MKIPEYKYAYYYWVDCQNFTDTEFKSIVSSFENSGLKIVDGYDEESHSFCIKIIKFIPSGIRDIKYCQQRNEQVGKKFIRTFQETISGKLYFNVNRRQLKWKE